MDSNPLQVSEPLQPSVAAPQTTTTVTRSWPRVIVRDLLETVLPALLIAVAMVVFVIQPTRVDGLSMEPTLHTEQRLVIEKVSYRFRAPEHEEIIVLKAPGREHNPLIKRVVATAGDVIAIRDGLVYLNGAPLREAYLNQVTPGSLSSLVVPEGYVYVLGDNRAASQDSRTFGMVPLDRIVGRAFISYWPPETIGFVR